MKVLGLVVEYNPFHNGHVYHIEQSKKATSCDAVVCVMSGNFIQRGEPAVINKFARAEAAIANGVDLVIELPVPFAAASAEFFGFGAVKILDSLDIVDCISFGSEHGEIGLLQAAADVLAAEPPLFKQYLGEALDQGLSFPASRQNALFRYFDNPNSVKLNSCASKDLNEILGNPNNILGIEYLKALKRLGSTILPYTIQRVSNTYNCQQLTGAISSATAIRSKLLSPSDNLANADCNSDSSNVFGTVPPSMYSILEREFAAGRGPISLNCFESIILGILRQIKPEQLRLYPDVSEGLEYRLINAASDSGGITELIDSACTKRYTRTRIQRILMSLLSGVTQEDINLFMQYGGPQYARILGFNSVGRELLSKAKRNSIIPLITKLSDYKNSCNTLIRRMIEIESQATDMYVLGYQNSTNRKCGQEFTSKLIIK